MEPDKDSRPAICPYCGSGDNDAAHSFCVNCGKPMPFRSGPQPGAVPIQVDYAGFWIRFGAYLIDAIILSVVQAVIYAVFGASLIETEGGELSDGEILARVVAGVVSIVYVIGFWAWRGQTPGKMAIRARIVKTDGSPIGIGTAILRYFGQILSTIVLLLGLFWIGWDSKKQGWHDKIAETYVVRE